MTAAPTVLLYGHRLQDPAATGISRYARGLPAAMARWQPPPFRYAMAASPEQPGPEGLPAQLAYFHPPGPRRVLHGAWSAFGHPHVDRFVGHPDLIHVLYPSTPVPSAAPVAYTFHDLMPLRHPEWFARYERWGFARAVNDAARRADAIVCDSAAVADHAHDLLAIPRARLHVVHMALSPEFFADLPAEDIETACRRYQVRPGGYLIALGTVSTRKNLIPVIEALAAHGGPQALPLLALGPPGSGSAEVAELIERRGVGDRVRLLGWVPSADVHALLRGARALVHPSVEEGFGLTPLEAMACGVPSIVSRQGSLPEVVGDASILADAHDPDSWDQAIGRVVDDETVRAGLIARGRHHAARFTWERTAQRTAEVYRSVLGITS